MIAAFANPEKFLKLSSWALPLATGIALALFAVGLPWALFIAPQDAEELDRARILYVHVPSAWWSMGIYLFMGIASFVGIVWGHALAHVAAKAAAPIGAMLAALCLFTGSLWGSKSWGTWWVWDARLTSMLILFLTYLGYLALHAAIEDEERAARMAAILCLAGLINLPIVKFAVDIAPTLHQSASVIRADGPAIHATMLWPLIVNGLAYLAAFVALLLANMRAEIFRKRAEGAAMRRARAA